MNQTVIYIAVGVLLPIIPAYIFYKILPPGKTIIKGPFQGFNIQLTGAFGGYFLVVLVVFGFIIKYGYRSEIWQITGYTDLKNSASKLERKNIAVSTRPPYKAETKPNEDGSFEVEVLAKQGTNGNINFPVLIFEHSDYMPANVHLSEKTSTFGIKQYKIKIDKTSRSIVIEDPIVLEKDH